MLSDTKTRNRTEDVAADRIISVDSSSANRVGSNPPSPDLVNLTEEAQKTTSSTRESIFSNFSTITANSAVDQNPP